MVKQITNEKTGFVWQVNVIVFAQEVVLDSQPAALKLNGRSLLYKTRYQRGCITVYYRYFLNLNLPFNGIFSQLKECH